MPGATCAWLWTSSRSTSMADTLEWPDLLPGVEYRPAYWATRRRSGRARDGGVGVAQGGALLGPARLVGGARALRPHRHATRLGASRRALQQPHDRDRATGPGGREPAPSGSPRSDSGPRAPARRGAPQHSVDHRAPVHPEHEARPRPRRHRRLVGWPRAGGALDVGWVGAAGGASLNRSPETAEVSGGPAVGERYLA